MWQQTGGKHFGNDIRFKRYVILHNLKRFNQMETPVKGKRKKKVLESYTSFGPQSPSTKRTAPSYTINAETLIPTSRFMLGKHRDKTPGPDYEKIPAMGKQIESNKRNASSIVGEQTKRECLRTEYKSYVGPGRYRGANISSMGKQFDSRKRSHKGTKWRSPEKAAVNRKSVLEEYKRMFTVDDINDLL